MTLALDTTRPLRSRRAHAELVVAVRDAPESEQETNYLEWKGRLDLSAKAGEATIAKAVLGFANRDPDVAARRMEGCAYLVVGVEPSNVTGVVPTDQAKLEAGVTVYVGSDIDWHADYVDVDSETVLVVTVEAPRWGDPIRPVRKAYLPERNEDGPRMPRGTVFVRHQASTERADDADVDMLSRRAGRQPGTALEIEVRVNPARVLGRVDVSEETVSAYVGRTKAALLARLPSEAASGLLAATGGILRAAEYRSEDAYRKEVQEYTDELERELPAVLLSRSILHDVGLLQLAVVNPTDTTFTDVKVELFLPVFAGVCRSEQDRAANLRLPRRPAPYGQGGSLSSRTGWMSDQLLRPLEVPDMLAPSVDRRAEDVRVIFKSRDVRAYGEAELEDIWVVLKHDAPDSLAIRWEATATAQAKGRPGGVIEVAAGALASPRELLAKPEKQDD